MEERGMNERIKKLRRESTETQAYIDMERARYFTETYKEHEGEVSVPELRAMGLKNYFAKKTISIHDGELIVGEKGCGPQASPTFPDLCCHTVEDLHIMNDRELINFKVTEEDCEYQEKEMIPYWEKRSMRHKILAHMTPEWKAAYGAGIYTEFMSRGDQDIR